MKSKTKLTRRKAKREQQGNSEAGFSLLETTISLLLMCVVGLGATSLFFFTVKNMVSAGDRELAMAVAQQRMEQLRNDSFNSLTATAGTTSTVTRAGRSYSITTTITDTDVVSGVATMKTISIKVVPDNESSVWARTISGVFGSVTLVTNRTGQTVGPYRAL